MDHSSVRDDCEESCRELDIMVAFVRGDYLRQTQVAPETYV
jgi:hypothetical protein